MRKVLVTGVGGASGMYTAKILKESGYYVVGTDANGYAAGSVICDEFCIVSKASNKEDFITDINRLLERFGIDVVLPNVDEELPIFAEVGMKAIISNIDTVNTCIDKWKFYLSCRDVLVVPYTELISALPLVARFVSKVIVKPVYGRGSKNIYVFDDVYEVMSAKSAMRFGYGFIIQEYIDGKEITVDVLVGKSGDIIVAAPRYRVHTYGGVSQVGRTVLHDKVLEFSADLCRHFEFYGPINIQFMEDRKTKKLYLTEVNPRLSGGIGITHANGANLPLMAINEHFGDPYAIPKLKEDLVFRIFQEYKDENSYRDCRE